MEKVKVKIAITDGNIFSIIGRVSEALRLKDMTKEAKEFTKRSMGASSYEEVLRLAQEYTEIS